MPRSLTRRAALSLAGVVLGAPALAQTRQHWRMVTSWARDLPGPGTSARRLAERIERLSSGRIEVKVFAAGEIVPALGVFDAVGNGTAQMGHSASFFWAGKIPAAQIFTTIPFGLTPIEHMAFLQQGGGQGLWDELYRPFNVKPFTGGNTGPSLGGWFTRNLQTIEDFRGLKIRAPGLGGEMFRKLGAVPVLTAPSDIFTSLRSGALDGAEFLGPWADLAQGFHQAARFYAWPGVTKPNGSSEALIAADVWNGLPEDLKAAVEMACLAESLTGLAEAEWWNAKTLDLLVRQYAVQMAALPDTVLIALRSAAQEAVDGLTARDEAARKVLAAYDAVRQPALAWSRCSFQAFLRARNS